jgi:hypothetical protein
MEASQAMSPLAIALISIIGSILILMLTLLISMVWDLKKDLRSQKDCINLKVDKSSCDRIMDKHEAWIKEVAK